MLLENLRDFSQIRVLFMKQSFSQIRVLLSNKGSKMETVGNWKLECEFGNHQNVVTEDHFSVSLIDIGLCFCSCGYYLRIDFKSCPGPATTPNPTATTVRK